MKNILLLVHDDAGQEARFQVALDVVRAVEGHLSCLDVSVMPMVMDDYVASAGQAMLLEDERTREAANRKALEARLAREQVSWDWTDATGAMAPLLSEASHLADLIVVNRKLDTLPEPDMQKVAGDVVLSSGKPILAVPDAACGLDVCGRALVCWDGSTAAMAALRAAIPLLALAREVVLLEIDDGSIGTPAEEAATYLSRHGISATIVQRHVRTRAPADVILEEIGDRHADYVVMGGFGHFRLTEALFGGVTRILLTESPVPLLLAH